MNIDMGITSILSLLSGVALFLFGMSLMGDGLKKAAGEKLELILYKLTNTPIKGVLLGTAVTAIIQSSSATTVMVVGFVNSGMMKVAQAIGIIWGQISVRVSRAGFCVFHILRDQTASHSFCLPRQSQRWSQSSVFCLRWCPRRVHIKMSAISCLDFPY